MAKSEPETPAAKRVAKADKPDGAQEAAAAIAAMAEPDRSLALRIDAIVKANAPGLEPRVWYSMPAWARDGKTVCFFQSGIKFKTRYSTLGFQQDAKLDEGNMWPVAFAIADLTPSEEARIAELVRRAAG